MNSSSNCINGGGASIDGGDLRHDGVELVALAQDLRTLRQHHIARRTHRAMLQDGGDGDVGGGDAMML